MSDHNYPTDLQTSSQLISDSLVSDPVTIDCIRQLAERNYEVHTGLTDKLADAVVEMAREPAIQEYCPNDIGKRFTDRQAIEKWLAKGRAAFLLIKHDVTDDDLHLVGYGWAGESSSSHAPGGETTFAIRIGEAGQGQGLATPFAQLIVNAAALLYNSKNFWLETWQSNGPAIHIYEKIGFSGVDAVPDKRPSIENGSVPDTRLYMSLPNDRLPAA
jgi:ribosomal protein S18 acetylase RimI-like enzyme